MSGIATGAVLIGAGISAYGQYQQGQSKKQAADYNAQVQGQQAQVANQEAIDVQNQGANTAASEQEKARQANATLRATGASSGVRTDTGTLGLLQDQNAGMGEFNALTARNNAARQAWGYQVGATNALNQGTLDTFEGNASALQGELAAGGTIISGFGSAAKTYKEMTTSASSGPGGGSSGGSK